MKMMITGGALLAFTAVIAGAMGAHGLSTVLNATQLADWHTAVRFEMYHGLGLLGLAAIADKGLVGLIWIARLMFAGTLLFSGSIYLLVMTPWHWLWPVTPLGGICLMLAWGGLLVSALRIAK